MSNTRYQQWLQDGVALRDALILERNDAMAKVNNLDKQIAELDRVLVGDAISPTTTAPMLGKLRRIEQYICAVLTQRKELTATVLAREVSGRYGAQVNYVRQVLSSMRQRGLVKARPVNDSTTYRGFLYSLPST